MNRSVGFVLEISLNSRELTFRLVSFYRINSWFPRKFELTGNHRRIWKEDDVKAKLEVKPETGKGPVRKHIRVRRGKGSCSTCDSNGPDPR